MADDDRTEQRSQPKQVRQFPLPYATECDLVMKGGITSGIVYPLAIVEIAKAFKLCNIGGTSAGAIAAAAAAAAELRRQRFGKDTPEGERGFQDLAELPGLLSDVVPPGGTKTRLFALFQPQPALRRVFDALAATLEISGFGKRVVVALKGLLLAYAPTTSACVCIGLLPLLFLPVGWNTALAVLWVLAVATVLPVVVVIWRVGAIAAQELPKNNFGFCSGMLPADNPHYKEALTVWLAAYLDELAGQALNDPGAPHKPLTFGDLDACGINLEMITTCLTFGRPFRLPFRDDGNVKENKRFYYKESELCEVMPGYVVDWMVEKSGH